MRVSGPLEEDDYRGKLGPGVIFGKWKESNWTRVRIKTPQRTTAAEGLVKNNLKRAVVAWALLTTPQHEAWEEYSWTITRYDSKGDPYITNGFCEFVGCWTLAQMVGLGEPTDAPEVAPPEAVESAEATGAPSPILKFILEWEWPKPQDRVEIMVSPAKQWTEKYYKNQVVFKRWFLYPTSSHIFDVDQRRKGWGWRIRIVSDLGQGGPWTTGIVRVEG